MRKVRGTDIFILSKIADKLNLDFSNYDFKTKDKQKLGAKIINDLLKNMWKAEKEIVSFLADISGKKTSEINELSIAELKDMITELSKDEELVGFFKSL